MARGREGENGAGGGDLSRTAVLIPALNEEEALPAVLAGLPPGLGAVVVVDNGSEDRTATVARSAGAEVVREPRRGYGAACLAGMGRLAASPSPPDVVVFMDGDGSDDPGALPRLAGPVLRGDADLALGVREGEPGAHPWHARLGTALVLAATRLLYGRRFADLPPFRAVEWTRLLELEMDDRDFGWTLQMQIRAVRRGLRIVEVPVPHRPRAGGRSKVSGTVRGTVGAGAKMLWVLARERARAR